ncbi:ABC transporter ATP-binding protein [Cytobacillus sp. FSL K6-0265]|uniref:ABC transporter ATP-binding protein n=1 Tax=Cytobacillus sp. FSL K6-0265 TaxID=2921448 RepID=UPI0030FCAA6A
MGSIKVEQIKKSFGQKEILKGIDVDIPDGSFAILLGPSGCGKSTLLRMIAGLEEPTSGSIFINDQDITYSEPKDRDIGMVFQNYALYPHMTVFKNIEYGLKIKKIDKSKRLNMVNKVIEMVELTEHANKRPGELSGGQRQRVALARAIVKRPHAFLMDEPLSNLDAKLRNQMRQELIELQKELQTTFLYVTHDQIEAMSMGSYIIIMNNGHIMQKGTPKEIYTNPANLFVAQFIGSPPTNILSYGDYSIGIRPENMSMKEDGHNVNADYILTGAVVSTEHLGGESIYCLTTDWGKVFVKGESTWQTPNKESQIAFSKKDVLVFDKKGERVRDVDLIENLLAEMQVSNHRGEAVVL